jgi:Concanavalin A-like lectin/glucanases superfamily
MARGRWNGGIIGPNLKVTTSSASGIFTLSEAQVDVSAGLLPQVPQPQLVVPDSQFNLNTLLLHGDGSNGAQNNTFLDSSSNNFSITRTGTPTQGTFSPFSQTGWSNYFNGSTDYLTASGNSAFNFGTNNFTLECWIFVPTQPSPTRGDSSKTMTLFDFGVYGSDQSFAIGGSSTNFGTTMEIYAPGASSSYTPTGVSISSTLSLSTWYHIAYVRNGNTLTAYVNGVGYSFPSVSGISFGSSSNNVKLGGSWGLSSSYYNQFLGYMSNIRIVNGTALYTSNFTPPTTPLTAISGTSLLTCQSNRFVDNSTNSIALTPTGSPSVQAFSPFAPATAYGVSSVGGSTYLNGSTDYLTLPSSTNFAFGTGDFTIEFWAYFTSSSSSVPGNVISTNTNSTGLSIYIVSTAIQLARYLVGGDLTASSNIKINQWTHYAITRSSGTAYIFVNGVLLASGSVSTSYNQNGLLIGNVDSVNYTAGYISNLRIVKGTAVYTSAFTPPTAPVTAIANTQLLVNGTNAGIYDQTAKNDLITVGSAQISTAQSKFGGSSMSFNGSTDYITTPYTALNGKYTGDFTVECWFYMNNVSSTQPIISQRTTNSTYCPYLLWVASGTLTLYMSSSNSSWDIINAQSLGTITAGQWYHYALVRSGSAIKSYLNGAVVGSGATSSATLDATSSNVLRIGGTGDPLYFNGYIDDLRITNGYARYTSNFTPSTSAFANQ